MSIDKLHQRAVTIGEDLCKTIITAGGSHSTAHAVCAEWWRAIEKGDFKEDPQPEAPKEEDVHLPDFFTPGALFDALRKEHVEITWEEVMNKVFQYVVRNYKKPDPSYIPSLLYNALVAEGRYGNVNVATAVSVVERMKKNYRVEKLAKEQLDKTQPSEILFPSTVNISITDLFNALKAERVNISWSEAGEVFKRLQKSEAILKGMK
jgi:hypothetical protein